MSTWVNRGASGGPCGGLEERKTEQPNSRIKPDRDSHQPASTKAGVVHSSLEACATPALRSCYLDTQRRAPGRCPTTLNRPVTRQRPPRVAAARSRRTVGVATAAYLGWVTASTPGELNKPTRCVSSGQAGLSMASQARRHGAPVLRRRMSVDSTRSVRMVLTSIALRDSWIGQRRPVTCIGSSLDERSATGLIVNQATHANIASCNGARIHKYSRPHA